MSENRAPRSFARHSNIYADRLTIGLGDVWVRDSAHTKIFRIDARSGSNKGVVLPKEFVPGFQMDATPDMETWMVADTSGIWITGRSDEEFSSTRAARGCAAIARTGPARDGPGVLVRFSATTHCPTLFIDYGSSWQDDPARVGFARSRLWLGIGFGLFPVDTSDGSFGSLQGYRLVGAGFGSIWGESMSSGGSSEAVDLARIDPVTERSAIISRTTFFSKCGASFYDVQCLAGEPELFWIDPRTNRQHELFEGNCCHPDGQFTSSRDHLFLLRGSGIRAWHKRSGTEIDSLHLPRDSYTRSMAAYEGVLWLALTNQGLWWRNIEA